MNFDNLRLTQVLFNLIEDSARCRCTPPPTTTTETTKREVTIIFNSYLTKEHLLKQLVGVYKRDWKRIHRRWSKITREHKTSIEQLRNEYSKIKAPKNLILPNRLKFSEEEDQNLLRFFKEKGMKWEKAGKFMKKKLSSVRNRYYYLLRKKNSKEED
jgi:hypothetical protein